MDHKVEELERTLRDLEYESRWSTVVLKSVQAITKVFMEETVWVTLAVIVLGCATIFGLTHCGIEGAGRCGAVCARRDLDFYDYDTAPQPGTCWCVHPKGGARIDASSFERIP